MQSISVALLAAILNAVYGCVHEVSPECDQMIKDFYLYNFGPIIVESEQELEIYCGLEKKASDCVVDSIHRCIPEQDKTRYIEDLNETRGITKALCGNGHFKNVYLKHLSCFKREALQTYNCAIKFHEGNMDAQDDVFACCHLYDVMDCSQAVIRNCCPTEAGDLYNELVQNFTKLFSKRRLCDLNVRGCLKVSLPFNKSCTPIPESENISRVLSTTEVTTTPLSITNTTTTPFVLQNITPSAVYKYYVFLDTLPSINQKVNTPSNYQRSTTSSKYINSVLTLGILVSIFHLKH